MFETKTHNSAAILVVGIACFAAPQVSRAANSIKLSGAIAGIVTNVSGIPQMGASVTLYNRQEHVFAKALTDARGEFHFAELFPDLYSVRVTLASFVPALKKEITVQPGMRSMLNVSLNTLFSSIQIGPPVENGTLMTDDWKWMLRSASATRPVLRFNTELPGSGRASSGHTAAFSDTRGVLKLSAGDGPLVTGVANEADLGTAFALATSLYGSNQLEFSGNLGYGAQTGVPAAAFRTSFSRSDSSSPEVSITMRQLLLPSHGGAIAGSDTALPALRSVSASVDEHMQLSDALSMQYGFTMDSVSFGDRLNYFSPYARFVYTIDDQSDVSFAYTSGNARPDLGGDFGIDSDLQRDLNTIGLFPRLSMLDGQAKIQRGEEYELTYTRKTGSRKYEVSAYREAVSNAAVSLMGPIAFENGPDILPDLFTGNAIFNAGNYQSTGYSASITQNLGENLSGTIIFGTMDGLTADRGELAGNNPDELRSLIRPGRRESATARIAATSPWTGTHIIASYQWLDDHRWLTPGRLYTTQSLRPMPGLNIYVRQPIPGLSMLPWRMEATADLRNLLAQGYLPFASQSGQQVVLVQTPRSVRGGLSFIF